MKPIVTLTLNPSIDLSCRAREVRPVRKIRTYGERYDSGGGGVNVARVVSILGGPALPVYLAGGFTGEAFDILFGREGIPGRRISTRGATRVSHTVYEELTGKEYRFIPEGAVISDGEWQAALDAVVAADADFVVASGSVPRGVPDDIYARLAERLAGSGRRLVLDTYGAPLAAGLQHGVYLAKPSIGELEALVGRPLPELSLVESVARDLVADGAAEILAVSMGHKGAVLATRQETLHLPAPAVTPISAVGAGDSFVGAMTYALAQGRALTDAFRLAVAAGTATVISPGAALCRREDVERLYRDLETQSLTA